MRRIFKKGKGIIVPDGTKVFPFLNPKDSTSGLPWDLLEGFSLAAGEIPPNTRSQPHIHLHVTHVTFVAEGTLTVRMKDQDSSRPCRLTVQPQKAVLTRPGSFFQLINLTRTLCKVLYIVSPAYLFEKDNNTKKIIYNDALVFDEAWEQLAKMNWNHPCLMDPKNSKRARDESYLRLARSKRLKI